MKTFKAALLASVLVTGVTVAYGQVSVDAGAGAAVGGEVSTDAGGVSAGADATVNAGANVSATDSADAGGSYADLSTSIASSGSADLSAVADTAEITIVLISSLEADAEATAWAELKSQNNASVEALHDNIEANAALSARLTAELSTAGDFSIDDVVAISTSANGALTVYVDDQN